MARRHVLVEAPLTSNEQILGVAGAAHPFQRYRAAGVPVALATDDPAISRIDFTHEFVTATTRYRLRYGALKDLARASLEHAFLPGRSLWRSPDVYEPTGACARDAPGAARPSRRCAHCCAPAPRRRSSGEQEARSNTFERQRAAHQRRH
jgi:adenosine deaminase